MIYISHKMAEIREIADDITIMRDGTYVGTWEVKNISDDEIVRQMVGRELTNVYPPKEDTIKDDVILEVKDLCSIHERSFQHISFQLKKGEILGFGGLVGAQRTELMEALFGIRAESYQAEYGSVELTPVSGVPEVFVIGGNGSGIPVYRKLQRQGIPFAAGVLHENDLDYPVAKALAVQVISERPYEPIGEAAYEEALQVMEKCRTVICSVQEFGSGNLKNADLLQRFMKKG